MGRCFSVFRAVSQCSASAANKDRVRITFHGSGSGSDDFKIQGLGPARKSEFGFGAGSDAQ